MPEWRLTAVRKETLFELKSRWRVPSRGQVTVLLRGLFDWLWRVVILLKCNVVGLDSVIISANDVLASCLGIGCIEKIWIQFQHLAEILDRLIIIFLLLSEFGPRVK